MKDKSNSTNFKNGEEKESVSKKPNSPNFITQNYSLESSYNELKKKYKDFPLIDMEENSENKEPLSIKKPKYEKDIIEPNMSLESLYAYIVSQRKNWLNILMNRSKNNIIYPKKDKKREQIVNFFDKNNIFLNHKRKRHESSKNGSSIDTSENNINIKGEEEDKGDKKIIFQ